MVRLHAYYNKLCDMKFEDAAITEVDFDAGEAELINSNDCDEADASGSLAGV